MPTWRKIVPMSEIFGNRWRVLKPLGTPRSGQGIPYIVEDTTGEHSGQFVLKTPHKTGTPERLEKRLERFRREVIALESLNHPNVLPIFDSQPDGNPPYLVSKFCTGGNLTDAYNAKKLDEAEIFRLFREMCCGVAAAHESGVVHRDLKPDNFLLESDGLLVVADFGCALLDAEFRLTNTSETVGSSSIRAPELDAGRLEDVTPACDVYSLGKVLYWMFTGVFVSREKYRTDEYDLVKLRTNVKFEHINQLLDKLLVEDPTGRPENASRLLEQFNAVEENWKSNLPVIDKIVEDFYFWRARICELASEFDTAYTYAKRHPGNASWKKATTLFTKALKNLPEDLEVILDSQLFEDLGKQLDFIGGLGVHSGSQYPKTAYHTQKMIKQLEDFFDTENFKGHVVTAYEAYISRRGTLVRVLMVDPKRQELETLFQDLRQG
jgi:serine/threonine protein kinase